MALNLRSHYWFINTRLFFPNLKFQKDRKITWTNSRRQWKTGKPEVLQSMGSQRVKHDWATTKKEEAKALESRSLTRCHTSFITFDSQTLQCYIETFEPLSLCCIKLDKNKTKHSQGKADLRRWPVSYKPQTKRQLVIMVTFFISSLTRGPWNMVQGHFTLSHFHMYV